MSNIISKQVNDDITARFHTRLESGYDTTVTDEIVIREIFDEDVYETPFDSLGGKVVMDIGANIGAYSIYAGLAGAEVYAFEPDDFNYEMLVENIKLNELQDRITVFKYGVYKDTGLHRFINGQGASFIVGIKHLTPEAKQGMEDMNMTEQSIETLTLHDAVKKIGKKIDVCKIDAEGSEYGLFEKADRHAMNSIKYLTMEFHQTDDTTYGKMLSKIQRTHNIHAYGKPNQGGQIIARIY